MFFAQTKKVTQMFHEKHQNKKLLSFNKKTEKVVSLNKKIHDIEMFSVNFLDPLWSIQNVKEWKHPNQKNEDVFVFCLFSNALRTLEEVWKGLSRFQDRFSHMPNSLNINDDILKHLESLSNLNAYLLPKNSVGVSFGHLVLRGPTVTRAHPSMLDLIYLASKTVLTSRKQMLPLNAGKKQVLCYKFLFKPSAFLRFRAFWWSWLP